MLDQTDFNQLRKIIREEVPPIVSKQIREEVPAIIHTYTKPLQKGINKNGRDINTLIGFFDRHITTLQRRVRTIEEHLNIIGN